MQAGRWRPGFNNWPRPRHILRSNATPAAGPAVRVPYGLQATVGALAAQRCHRGEAGRRPGWRIHNWAVHGFSTEDARTRADGRGAARHDGRGTAGTLRMAHLHVRRGEGNAVGGSRSQVPLGGVSPELPRRGAHLSLCPRPRSGLTTSLIFCFSSFISGKRRISVRFQTSCVSTQTLKTPVTLPGRIATSASSFSKVVSNSCAVQPARRSHLQPVQYSMVTRGPVIPRELESSAERAIVFVSPISLVEELLREQSSQNSALLISAALTTVAGRV
jgi:hypothetical protein